MDIVPVYPLPFPARITAVTNTAGIWVYSWEEWMGQHNTSVRVLADPCRYGNTSVSPAYELNNQNVAVNTIVHMWPRGVVGGQLAYEFDDPTGGGGVSTAYPGWVKITVDYTDIAVASTSTDIEIYSLPAKGCVHGAVLKVTTAFANPIAETVSVTVGYAASSNGILTSFNANAAPSDTSFRVHHVTANGPLVLHFGSASSIRLYAGLSIQNLDEITAGSLDVYLLLSTLP